MIITIEEATSRSPKGPTPARCIRAKKIDDLMEHC